MCKYRLAIRRFVGCFVSVFCYLLAFSPPAAAQRAMPDPAPLPNFNPLCDSSLVHCLQIDRPFAGHLYGHLQVLNVTDEDAKRAFFGVIKAAKEWLGKPGREQLGDIAEEGGEVLASPSTYVPGGILLGKGGRIAVEGAEVAVDAAKAGKKAVRVVKAAEHAAGQGGKVIARQARQEVADKAAARAVPKLHPGKQGKHVPGDNNFIPGGSELTHPDPQGLLDRHAGRGVKHGNKEVVDFGEMIGNNVTQDGVKTPTTRGTIHYSDDGKKAHIVPAKPIP